jgi:hypothetical protein
MAAVLVSAAARLCSSWALPGAAGQAASLWTAASLLLDRQPACGDPAATDVQGRCCVLLLLRLLVYACRCRVYVIVSGCALFGGFCLLPAAFEVPGAAASLLSHTQPSCGHPTWQMSKVGAVCSCSCF